MARNRRNEDRALKRDAIIAAARDLFISEGFEATLVSRLAAAAFFCTSVGRCVVTQAVSSGS